MLKHLKWWWDETKLRRTYEPDLAKLRKGGKREEYDSLDSEYAYYRRELAEERRLYYQRRLMNKAYKLYIPVPQFTAESKDDMWERGVTRGEFLLTNKALTELSRAILEDRKARRDFALGWVSPFTGIIGTVIGFLLAKLSN